MTDWIAVDGGQSATRVRGSWQRGHLTDRGYRSSTPPDALAADLVSSLRRLEPPHSVSRIAIGHTGMPPDTSGRRVIADALQDVCPQAEVLLGPDWVTAHAGALNGRSGVVLVAGTGSVALGLAANGCWISVDGHGHLLGDRGSAFALGRAGLAEALQLQDTGDTTDSALLTAASAYLGRDLEAGVWKLYNDPDRVNRVAQFAPTVLALADAGDQDAARLVTRAAADLANTTTVACRRLPREASTITWSGRFISSPSIKTAYLNLITTALPDWTITEPVGDSLAGATLLASGAAPLHARLCTIETPSP